LGKRLVAVIVAFTALAALIAVYIAVWATQMPGAVAATVSGTGAAKRVALTLETVAAVGPTESPQHPDWVSYLVHKNGHWIHSTIFRLPAHSLVHVTIYQFDGDSGLRNPWLAEVQGTTGGVMDVNGKPMRSIDPDDASHTFVVPQLGLFIPLLGVDSNAKNQCGYGPCTLSFAHNTITFTFRTPGKGRYRWQCFVPCAAGTYLGFGGPMQTLGYMDGFLDVV